MIGILSALFTLEGIGIGGWMVGQTAKSVLKEASSGSSYSTKKRVPVCKSLYKHCLIIVKEAYFDECSEIYYATIESEYIRASTTVWATTQKGLYSEIDKVANEMSKQIDERWKRII